MKAGDRTPITRVDLAVYDQALADLSHAWNQRFLELESRIIALEAQRDELDRELGRTIVEKVAE